MRRERSGSLVENNIGVEGARAVAEAIKTNRTLTKLSLRSAEVSYAMIKEGEKKKMNE